MSSYPEPTVKKDFLSGGVAELKRKWLRTRMRKDLRACSTMRSKALVALGRLVWQHQIKPPGSESLLRDLEQLGSRSAAASQQQEQLQSDIQAQREKNQTTRKQLDKQHQEARTARKQLETVVKKLQSTISKQQAAAQQTQVQLTAVDNEIQGLQHRSTTDPVDRSDAPDPEQRAATLQKEQQQLTTRLARVNQSLQETTPRLSDLQQQVAAAKTHEEQDAEQRSQKLAQNDNALRQLEETLRAVSSQQSELSSGMNAQFLQLGAVVMASETRQPAIESACRQVTKQDEKSRSLEKILSESQAKTASMPRWTMPLFFGVIGGIPVLLVTLSLILYVGIGKWKDPTRPRQLQEQEETQQMLPTGISPYINHPLKDHLAYRLADKLAKAREDHSIREVRTGLYRVCKAIHLGIYRLDGRRVLQGCEQSGNDFFLYEFMRNILGKSYINYNVMTFDAHTNMLARVLSRTENVDVYDKAFREALFQRYADAKAHPDNPQNFLPLVLDGLARHQDLPYSLEELRGRDTGELEIDDIQSFLIMLDFYVPPPQSQVSWLQDMTDVLVPTVHASSPCDRIAGDGSKAAWGTGQGVLADLLSHLGDTAAGKAGDAVGKANLITGLIGDILVLRGIQLDIEPTGGVMIDLPHVGKGTDPRDLPTCQFTAVATFECELSQDAAQCGWLLGKEIPKDGPLKDVEITWDFEPALTRVQFHNAGEFVANTRMLTDENGRATVTLRSTPCPEPKGRKLAGQHHRVQASARFVSAKMPNPLAALGGVSLTIPISMLPGFYEIVMGGRKTYSTLDIGWHEKRPDDEQY